MNKVNSTQDYILKRSELNGDIYVFQSKEPLEGRFQRKHYINPQIHSEESIDPEKRQRGIKIDYLKLVPVDYDLNRPVDLINQLNNPAVYVIYDQHKDDQNVAIFHGR